MEVTIKGTPVVFTVKSGGAIRYDFEALSKAQKPVPYMFTGTVETYLFDRDGEPGHVNFSYSKRDGGTGFRHATYAARERWIHVLKFIRSEVIPAARAYAKTAEYETAKLAAVRDALDSQRQTAERDVARCVRHLESARDELAAATAKLASFDARHGAAPE